MNTLCASDRQRYSLVAMRLMATTNAILSATAAVRSLAFLQHHAVQHGMKKRLWTTRSGSILSFSQAPGSKWSPLPFLRPSWDAQRRLRSLPSQKRLAISRSKNSGEGDNDVSSAAREAETWTTDKVRATFIEYFTNRCNHTYHPSSSCVPLNDPTLLFTNAGMNQFKSMFLGQIDPNSPLATLRRVVNSQKCIRAGGKHNDLDDVGRDTYHHTFFEMLGTWSFGDYFKKEAIDYAWEILTKVYKIDEHRLYATYFDGDDKLGLGADLEAKKYWMRYLPEERVIGCNAKDNFWEVCKMLWLFLHFVLDGKNRRKLVFVIRFVELSFRCLLLLLIDGETDGRSGTVWPLLRNTL